jgi:hypothetical protein
VVLAGDIAQLEAHGLDRQQQIGEDDGGVDVQQFDRLESDGGRQVGPFTHFEDAIPLADVPVLLEIAAGLPHEPYRPDIGGPAAAGVEEAACHWSHAHG